MTPKAEKPPCEPKPRGGHRANAGRKRKTAAIDTATSNEVLSRLGELGIPGVKTKADYILYLMRTDARHGGMLFLDMLNRSEGKPAQARIAQSNMEIFVREIGAGTATATETGVAEKVM